MTWKASLANGFIREICREAGICVSSFYNYYPAKKALLDRVIGDRGAHMRYPLQLDQEKIGMTSLLLFFENLTTCSVND